MAPVFTARTVSAAKPTATTTLYARSVLAQAADAAEAGDSDDNEGWGLDDDEEPLLEDSGSVANEFEDEL
jgi:hypothetical protein|tara:strand:- start:249 stop:458 length:210 start_codon:yes stop_codon:yes gene_type:complete